MSDPLDRLMVAILAHVDLLPLEAGILASAHLGLAGNSRDFAKQAGIAHALVIRACVELGEVRNLLILERHVDQSQRVFFNLTQDGQTMIDAVLDAQEG